MSSTTVPTQQQTPASVSSFGRVFGALFDPKPTFESIAQRPSWVWPLLILIVLSTVIIALVGQRVGWRQVIEKQIANSPSAQQRMEQLPPEQRQRVMETQTKYAAVFGYVSVILYLTVGPVVVAALLLAIFNVIGGAKVGFSTSLGIVAHSWMPYAISALLGIVILFIKDPTTIDVQNLVASNPGALLAEGSPKWLVALLTSLDLFTFWALLLEAIGYRATNPKKISFGMALGCVVGLWILWVFVKVGFAAAFS
ncbi:MAG TPA: YIP1 family protein [Candidatus Cybelea sp.]|nr:YIP1 family protein [Candidatus Cybelea sp.]